MMQISNELWCVLHMSAYAALLHVAGTLCLASLIVRKQPAKFGCSSLLCTASTCSALLHVVGDLVQNIAASQVCLLIVLCTASTCSVLLHVVGDLVQSNAASQVCLLIIPVHCFHLQCAAACCGRPSAEHCSQPSLSAHRSCALLPPAVRCCMLWET